MTAPSITGPSLFEITVAAVDAAGTAANQLTDQFIAEYVATDIVDGDVTITNDAPAQFALGNTTVTLTRQMRQAIQQRKRLRSALLTKKRLCF